MLVLADGKEMIVEEVMVKEGNVIEGKLVNWDRMGGIGAPYKYSPPIN